jgi:hypothetical protein
VAAADVVPWAKEVETRPAASIRAIRVLFILHLLEWFGFQVLQ